MNIPRQSITLPDGSRGFTPKRSQSDTIREKAAKRAEREKVKREAEKQHTRKRISVTQRQRILQRDDFTCQLCGVNGGKHNPAVELHIDHIVSVKDGGGNTDDNLRTTCIACNLGRVRADLQNVTRRARGAGAATNTPEAE